jgi:3-oxoacyl-[acyl-carrier protein] reductase
MELKGTVAIVTGGGTGIGQAVCRRLAEAGARAVIVNYARSQAEAEATAQELSQGGTDAVAHRADVSREAEVRAMVGETVRRFGRLDVLVNNAGTTHYIDFADLDGITDQVWEQLLDTNLKGTFYCSRAAAPELRKARGSIVNVASVAGHRGAGSSIPYGVTKAGIIQLTRGLAIALAPEVRVNSVSPGQVVTRWPRVRRGLEWAEATEAASAARTPLKGSATADHVAQAVMWFVSSDWVTGEDLIVDGGRHAAY